MNDIGITRTGDKLAEQFLSELKASTEAVGKNAAKRAEPSITEPGRERPARLGVGAKPRPKGATDLVTERAGGKLVRGLNADRKRKHREAAVLEDNTTEFDDDDDGVEKGSGGRKAKAQRPVEELLARSAQRKASRKKSKGSAVLIKVPPPPNDLSAGDTAEQPPQKPPRTKSRDALVPPATLAPRPQPRPRARQRPKPRQRPELPANSSSFATVDFDKLSTPRTAALKHISKNRVRGPKGRRPPRTKRLNRDQADESSTDPAGIPEIPDKDYGFGDSEDNTHAGTNTNEVSESKDEFEGFSAADFPGSNWDDQSAAVAKPEPPKFGLSDDGERVRALSVKRMNPLFGFGDGFGTNGFADLAEESADAPNEAETAAEGEPNSKRRKRHDEPETEEDTKPKTKKRKALIWLKKKMGRSSKSLLDLEQVADLTSRVVAQEIPFVDAVAKLGNGLKRTSEETLMLERRVSSKEISVEQAMEIAITANAPVAKPQRKKVRSRQKNIRKDNRPAHLKPKYLTPGSDSYKAPAPWVWNKKGMRPPQSAA